MPVALVIVSHSDQLARGVCEVARQMAPDVVILPAGGTDTREIGTSFDKTLQAIEQAISPAGVVVLFDLGSAQLTADLVAETLTDEQRAQVRIVDAPLVEGAIAAAVAAQNSGDIDDVVRMATSSAASDEAASALAQASVMTQPQEPTISRVLTLPNPLGLHARPAALLTRIAARYDVTVLVGPPGESATDIRSVLGVVALGLRGGDRVELTATGPYAQEVLDRISAEVEAGFGELESPPSQWSPALTSERETLQRTQPPVATPTEQIIGQPTPLQPHDSFLQGVNAPPEPDSVFYGTPGVPGLALGPVLWLHAASPVIPDDHTNDSAADRANLETALTTVDTQLQHDSQAAGDRAASEIIDAHRAMLADPQLRGDAFTRIDAGSAAPTAWWTAIEQARKILTATGGVAAGRAVDVTDIGLRVLAVLRPDLAPVTVIPASAAGAVVLADDIVPSLVPTIAQAGAVGLALTHGGPTSHAVIVARGLSLVTVVGLGPELHALTDGQKALLDGEVGLLAPNPSRETIKQVRETQAMQAQELRAAQQAAQRPVVLADGRRIHVCANVASAAEARAAHQAGADGIGLLRTELLFLDRPGLPSEQEQQATLAEIFTALPDRPIVVRTLDVGGDKPIPALGLDPALHGFLGLRGLRYGLAHPQVLQAQLRAVLQAAHGATGPVRLMAPMVTVVDEVHAFRDAITTAAASLDADSLPYGLPDEIGVMIEVPAAALAGDEICRAVDFVSIGSNDLVQYLLAADRTNETVGHLYQPDHPAVWVTLERIVTSAHAADFRVAVCGEMAAHPDIARRLIALGVDELSMAAASIPNIKAVLHNQ